MNKEVLKFIKATNKHKFLFRVSAACLNHFCHEFEDVTLVEIQFHDNSKFGVRELDAYSKKFFGDGCSELEWQSALMHHYKHNKHHWQNWLYGYTKIGTEKECEPYMIPEHDVMAMIADWLAASFQYTQSWDMSNWLTDNVRKMILHDLTKCKIDRILEFIGYKVNGDVYTLIDLKFVDLLEKEHVLSLGKMFGIDFRDLV